MGDRVSETIAAVERFMATVDDAMAIPGPAAAFIHGLILATGARSGVEIGMSYGYSALWAGAALRENGGRLVTIDHDPRKCERAQAFFAQAGLEECIEVRQGRAIDVLNELEGPIDYVLNDADKENCIRYVELISDRLAERAVVVTDNTLTHTEALRPFMNWVRAHPEFYSFEVAVGNGMEVSVRRTQNDE